MSKFTPLFAPCAYTPVPESCQTPAPPLPWACDAHALRHRLGAQPYVRRPAARATSAALRCRACRPAMPPPPWLPPALPPTAHHPTLGYLYGPPPTFDAVLHRARRLSSLLPRLPSAVVLPAPAAPSIHLHPRLCPFVALHQLALPPLPQRPATLPHLPAALPTHTGSKRRKSAIGFSLSCALKRTRHLTPTQLGLIAPVLNLVWQVHSPGFKIKTRFFLVFPKERVTKHGRCVVEWCCAAANLFYFVVYIGQR